MSDRPSNQPEYWGARGIGTGYGNGRCWVSGREIQGGPDLSGFVVSREAGGRVVAMLGNAQLDFRPSEPDWIQVKIAVADEHTDVLERLYIAVRACDWIITERLIAWVRDPEGCPGYKPTALTYLDRAVLAENSHAA